MMRGGGSVGARAERRWDKATLGGDGEGGRAAGAEQCLWCRAGRAEAGHTEAERAEAGRTEAGTRAHGEMRGDDTVRGKLSVNGC